MDCNGDISVISTLKKIKIDEIPKDHIKVWNYANGKEYHLKKQNHFIEVSVLNQSIYLIQLTNI